MGGNNSNFEAHLLGVGDFTLVILFSTWFLQLRMQLHLMSIASGRPMARELTQLWFNLSM